MAGDDDPGPPTSVAGGHVLTEAVAKGFPPLPAGAWLDHSTGEWLIPGTPGYRPKPTD